MIVDLHDFEVIVIHQHLAKSPHKLVIVECVREYTKHCLNFLCYEKIN